jgi:hypothetical protein
VSAARRQPVASDDDSTIDPQEVVRIVGQTFVKHEYQPVLAIGKLTWSRLDLAQVNCPHPKAAAAITRICQQLGITTLQQLADRAPEIGTYKGLGVTAYYTVLGILKKAGFPTAQVHGEDVSFLTLKHRAQEETDTSKRRRRQRRNRKG